MGCCKQVSRPPVKSQAREKHPDHRSSSVGRCAESTLATLDCGKCRHSGLTTLPILKRNIQSILTHIKQSDIKSPSMSRSPTTSKIVSTLEGIGFGLPQVKSAYGQQSCESIMVIQVTSRKPIASKFAHNAYGRERSALYSIASFIAIATKNCRMHIESMTMNVIRVVCQQSTLLNTIELLRDLQEPVHASKANKAREVLPTSMIE